MTTPSSSRNPDPTPDPSLNPNDFFTVFPWATLSSSPIRRATERPARTQLSEHLYVHFPDVNPLKMEVVDTSTDNAVRLDGTEAGLLLLFIFDALGYALAPLDVDIDVDVRATNYLEQDRMRRDVADDEE